MPDDQKGSLGACTNTVGANHEFTRNTYAYLNLLYQKWRKPELADQYKQKYIEAGK